MDSQQAVEPDLRPSNEEDSSDVTHFQNVVRTGSWQGQSRPWDSNPPGISRWTFREDTTEKKGFAVFRVQSGMKRECGVQGRRRLAQTEAVSDSANGFNRIRKASQFLAQRANVYVHRTFQGVRIIAAAGFQELVAGERSSRLAGQRP